MLKAFAILVVIINFENVNTCDLEKFETISECLLNVLGFRSTVIVKYDNDLISDEYLFSNKIIEKLSVNNIQQVIFNDLNKINELIVVEKTDWLVVAYFSKCDFYNSLNFNKIQSKMKYLIIMSHLTQNECRIELDKIKIYVAKYQITFIFKGSVENNYKFITFMPQIDKITCKEVVKDPVKINSCGNNSIKQKSVFPLKDPKNLNNCPLNVGIGTLFPFSMIKDKERFKTFDKLNESDVTGSDIAITRIIATQLNTSINVYYVDKNEENPIGKYDFIPFIVNGSLDMCVGGFYRIYQDFVAYSGIYASQSVIWMYTADRETRSWLNLAAKVDGLYIFFMFYLSYSCMWYLICKFDKRAVSMSTTLLYGWGALVGADELPNACSIKQKILNLSYLIMCIHLSAYISVQFYSHFTILEPPELFLTNNDVMKSGRTPYLVPISKYFVSDDNYVRFANTSEECTSFLDCFNKCMVNKGLSVFLDGLFLNYQAKTSVNEEAKVLSVSENVLTVYYEMLIRKDSPYVVRLQKIIQCLFESGIPERLFKEALGFNVIGKAKSARVNMISNSYSCQTGCEITLEQMVGVFYLWMIGCGVSCFIFILEIISNKKYIQK